MKTVETAKEHLINFCALNNFKLEERGECGFGRECVGIQDTIRSCNYVDYNPSDSVNYDKIAGLQSEKHYDFAPENAYHKHDCFAVLVRGGDYDAALIELSEWVEKIEANGYEVKEFSTGATGFQAMISGVKGRCIALK